MVIGTSGRCRALTIFLFTKLPGSHEFAYTDFYCYNPSLKRVRLEVAVELHN